MQQARALRPMGLLEIIDQTFRLYRANFGVFFSITAVIFIPLGLLQGAPGLMLSSPGLVFGIITIGGLFSMLTLGALTKAVSDRYLGQSTSLGSAYRYMAKRLFAFLLTLLLAYLFVWFGAVLLIVGSFVFLFWCSLLIPTFVIEDKRYFAAIWRSRFLVGKGVWAEVVVIVGMMVLFMVIMEYAVSAPLGMLLASQGPAAFTSFSPTMLVLGLVAGAAQALVYPLWLVALILLYYDSRIRKEGFDLQVLAREMGVTLSEPAAPAPSAAATAAVPTPAAPPSAIPPAASMPSAAPPPSTAAAPQTAEATRPAWQPSDPRLSSRMPLSALRRIFVFTDSDGRATPGSGVVLDTVQDTAGAPIREFENRVPVNIIAQSNAGAEVTRTRAVPESVWAAMSRIDTDLTARARNEQARTCVRGFTDPETQEQGVIIMVYDA